MPNAERFLEEGLGLPRPSRDVSVTTQPCCLCGEAIGASPFALQRFEADPTGTDYLAHVPCAREYAMCLRAFRGVIDRLTPA
jgi:hypothetical protein